MKVTQLDGGNFTSAAGIWRQGEPLDRQDRFPIPVYLIEVGEERILRPRDGDKCARASGDQHALGDDRLSGSG